MRKVAVVTTGFFDGVHLGHRQVVKTLVSCARERGEEAVVVTFWPHPRAVLQQDARDFRLLSSLEEKRSMLLGLGVDRVEVLPFTRDFAALTAAEYLDLLRERYGATLVVMGYDNRIGSDRLSAVSLAGLYSRHSPAPTGESSPSAPQEFIFTDGVVKTGFPLRTSSLTSRADSTSSPLAGMTGETPAISSTLIRQAIADGSIELASAMLGYDYRLYGVVVAGNHMGRTIGFPTANMQLYEPLKLVPADGVYEVDVEVLGSKFKGMCNIGMRPTVGGAARTIETNIFDFDQDIYGLPVKLSFIRRIREERRFPSLDALREQLEKDKKIIMK